MKLVWMLVTIIGNQAIESGVTYGTARACFEQAANLQAEAFKAVDLAFGPGHQQNSPAAPVRPMFSCIVAESIAE